MRQQMRRNMRSRNYSGAGSYNNENYRNAYREGYKHGWEDSEDEHEENFRRDRDSRGRFE